MGQTEILPQDELTVPDYFDGGPELGEGFHEAHYETSVFRLIVGGGLDGGRLRS
jgi:hypothetical protein